MDECLAPRERIILRQGVFLVKDKIDNKKLDLKHISTDVMWSGILNKLKQVTTFRVFRGALVNVS